jgi:hypothetical protein
MKASRCVAGALLALALLIHLAGCSTTDPDPKPTLIDTTTHDGEGWKGQEYP